MKQPPKYRHHRASGQAAVVLGGQWFYLGEYGSPASWDLYWRRVREWQAGVAAPHPDLTVAAVLDAYREHAGGRVGRSQLARIDSALKVAHRLYGDTPAADFRGRALKAVRADMLERHHRKTLNQLVSCIKQCWRWALSEELVPAESAQSVLAVAGLRRGECGARETAPVKPVPLADVEATLPHLPAAPADMVRVQLLTGVRPGEVVRMRGDELDRSRPDLWVWRPDAHKTAHLGHAKQAFLGPRAIAVVTPRLNDGYLFPPVAGRARGGHYRRLSYATAIARAAALAGVPHWHPNQLRHAAATLFENEFGVELARIYLGHRHLATTKIYAQDDLAKVAEAVRKVG